MLGSDPLTVPRVGLDADTLASRFAYALDVGSALALEVRPYKLLEARVAQTDGSRSRRNPAHLLGARDWLTGDADGEEPEGFEARHGRQGGPVWNGDPRDVRRALGFLVRPDASETRATVDAGVYDLGPFTPVTEFEEDARTETESLLSGHAQVGPVKVQARLDLVLDLAWGCAGHEAPTLSYGCIDTAAQIEGVGILKGPRRLEVNINEKFENFSLLFDDVESLAARKVGQVRAVEFIEVLVGDVELAAVHEDVGRGVRPSACPPLDEHSI